MGLEEGLSKSQQAVGGRRVGSREGVFAGAFQAGRIRAI